MAYTKFLDPLGPGTRAWTCFDNALEAFRQAPPHGDLRWKGREMKRYYNQRSYMVAALRKEHASESCIAEWLESLKQQCNLPTIEV